MLQQEHSAILLTFIKLPFVIKICVLSIFGWPFYTGFSVHSFFTQLTCKITLISMYLKAEWRCVGPDLLASENRNMKVYHGKDQLLTLNG